MKNLSRLKDVFFPIMLGGVRRIHAMMNFVGKVFLIKCLIYVRLIALIRLEMKRFLL